MRLLFAYNANFKQDVDGVYYTGGSINEEMWERYTSISDELTIISRLDKDIYEKEYAKKKFNIFDNSNKRFIPIPNLYSNIKDLINIKMHRNLYEIIKKNVMNNDFIIARVPSNVGNVAIKYAKKYRKPYLVEVVGCTWDAFWNHSLKGKIVAPFSYLMQKKNVRDAKYVVYVTNKFLQRRYPTNGKNTNCSNVSLTEFDNNLLRARMSKISDMDDDNKLIIGTTAAVNVRFKGQQYVIQALGRLKKQGITNYEYQLVGGGEQSYLKSVAERYDVSEQVKFLGFMPHNEVFNWLDTIDIYVQPSRQEGLPRALIEAMSRGLPAFGARTAGIPELLENDFIFNNTKTKINEMKDIINSLDKETMLEQAKRNYEESKKYEKSVIEERRSKFFEEFINSSKTF